MTPNKDFESVIQTAILTAYPRTLSDIPYAKEVFDELNKHTVPKNLIINMLAPEIEARYKLVSRLLKESGVNQVLEIAAGYSTRGFDLTKNDGNISYVELDLPEVCDRKVGAINSFATMPENLHVVSGNALRQEDINKCEQFFQKESPVAVTNEGLLRYLDFDEKKQVATNIYKLLSRHGGVWITCDVTPKKFIANQDANLPQFNEDLTKMSDRNNSNWRFEDLDHVKKFFGELGFSIESAHPFSEVKEELTSPEKLNLDDAQVDNLLKDALVVVMRISDQ